MNFDKTFAKSFRAQFWSFDVIFALLIFSVAVTILTYVWFNINNQLAIGYGNGATIMQLQTKALASSMFSTGSPPNWQGIANTTNTVTWNNVSVGLVVSPLSTNVSSSKLYTLISMANYNYEAAKQQLGTAYDYYITIKSTQAAGAAMNISIGRNPLAFNALTTFVERRNGFINGVPVTVAVELWTNSSIATS